MPKKLTDTQLEYVDLLKKYGFIIVTEGPTYATFFIRDKQMGTSSFEALKEHNMIKRISMYKSPIGVIISIWQFKPLNITL